MIGTRSCVFDAPINGAKFLAYVAQLRVPVLSTGDIVMRDNPGSDKVAGVRKAIAAAAAAPCFLPAYSPDFDPIDPSAGSGGRRQLSAGFSTNLPLLEPEAGFAQTGCTKWPAEPSMLRGMASD